uniref:G_PROTEIN_RECEP_F1_2 domain-containing protein n=1 Tax=Angiostrongylus cantonensis TaxID=6313 RepID=A0A0K0DEZ8_ANGCA
MENISSEFCHEIDNKKAPLVGLVVTPLGAWSTVAGTWRFGVTLCDIWISVDVIVCTSSILHLVAIALDRYWSVTDISYSQNRTPKRIIIMLAVIWLTSLLISLAPFAGWKDDAFKDRVLRHHVCLISQQISYQVNLFNIRQMRTNLFIGSRVMVLSIF